MNLDNLTTQELMALQQQVNEELKVREIEVLQSTMETQDFDWN